MKKLILILFLLVLPIIAQQQVTITVTLGTPGSASSSSATTTITLTPHVLLQGIVCTPDLLGGSANCVVTINIPAPSLLTPTIGAYPTNITGPSSFNIITGATSGTFTISMSNPTAKLSPSITNWGYINLPMSNSYQLTFPILSKLIFMPTVWMGGIN